jgi:hypothetical protein
MLTDKKCRRISSPIIAPGPPVVWRITRFSNGNIEKITAAMVMLETKTRRMPKCPTARGKTTNWKMPSMHPDTDIQRPIDAGLKLSPPNSTGVDQMSGRSVIADISMNESIA